MATIYNAEALKLLRKGAKRHDENVIFKHDIHPRVHHFDDLVEKIYEELTAFDSAVIGSLTLQGTIEGGSTYSGPDTVSITSTSGSDSNAWSLSPTTYSHTITDGTNTTTVAIGDDVYRVTSLIDATGVGGTLRADVIQTIVRHDGAGSTLQDIMLNGTQMLITDTINTKGLEYAADYSGAFTNESLITKRYVDSAVSGIAPTLQQVVDNGSTYSGTTIAVSFDHNDTSKRTQFAWNNQYWDVKVSDVGTGANGRVSLSDSSSSFLWSDGTNDKAINFNATNITITDTVSSKGIVYGADYSSNFVARSLIDLGYLQSNYSTASGADTQIAFFTGSNTQSGDSNFIWNNTNKNLGLGAAPDAGFHLHIKESTNKAQLRIESTTTENAVLSLVHSATGGAGDRNSAITFKEDSTTHWTLGLNGTGGGADDEFILVNGTDMDASPVLIAQKTNGYLGVNTGTGVNPAALLHVGAATTSAASIRITSSAAVNVAAPVTGDLWWNGTNLYFYDGSANQDLLVGGGGGLSNVVDDTTPQLGGSLDVNGNKIVSVSNGDIDIEPNGTGNVLLGNLTFDADQTVGAGQDNYVLTYDNAAGVISLEAAAGGSSVFTNDAADNLFGGTQSGTALTGTSGQRCFFGGYRAGYLVTSGKYNVAIGERALSNAATTGQSNVAIGSNTSKNITSGSYNVNLGLEAGNDISTGNYNVMIGFQAGRGSNGNRNTIIGGFYTGTNSGNDNTIIGANATSTSVYGDKNIVIGRCVPDLATGNVAIGYNVQQNGDVTGNGNIFIHPSHAATSNYNAVTGNDNCVIGLDVEVPTGLSNYVSLYNIYRGDHSAGECYMACPSTAAADGDLNNSEVHFSVDETGNTLGVKVKYSSGVVKTATVALT